jgi:hypothetical protein
VIFTTADLWTTEVDLSQSDIQTGNVEPEAVGLLRQAYVMYQYHLSPGIKHQFGKPPLTSELSEILETEPTAPGRRTRRTSRYVRTVHVVSAVGIAGFLSYLSEAL